jgi:hypothetical protein
MKSAIEVMFCALARRTTRAIIGANSAIISTGPT